MMLEQPQSFAIKIQGNIVSIFSSKTEAECALFAMRNSDPLLESAQVVVVDVNSRELLLG